MKKKLKKGQDIIKLSQLKEKTTEDPPYFLGALPLDVFKLIKTEWIDRVTAPEEHRKYFNVFARELLKMTERIETHLNYPYGHCLCVYRKPSDKNPFWRLRVPLL